MRSVPVNVTILPGIQHYRELYKRHNETEINVILVLIALHDQDS